MLTEIEWWGGIIFLLWAFSYYFIVKEWDYKKDFSYVNLHMAFVLSAVVLAMYFYTLETIGVKYFYLASLGIAIVTVLLLIFLPVPDEETEQKSGNASADDEDSNEEGGEEDIGKGLEIFGQAIIVGPLLISCLLGLYKSYYIAEELGWLG